MVKSSLVFSMYLYLAMQTANFSSATKDSPIDWTNDSVDDLLQIARHGSGENVYLIRFHYIPPGATDPPRWVGPS
jgi:hypothetical protein